MPIGACLWETHRRYQDLDALVDYREYDGEWTTWFEELASAHANSSYAQVRVMVSNRSAWLWPATCAR